MGFYRDGKWQYDAAEIASGEVDGGQAAAMYARECSNLRKEVERLKRERDEAVKAVSDTYENAAGRLRDERDHYRERAERYRKALLPFAALEPSSLYHEDDLSSDYDPGYVLMLIEDGQRPEITRDDISRARRALADEEGGK